MDGISTSINAILKNLIKNFNTLLDCPVRYSGEYNREKIHRFIEYIEYYKRIKCITDDQALQELQYLLTDQAHNWWLRRKVNISTWSEALTILENQYSKKRSANIVYTEILKHHYEDYDCKDDFIDDKLELFYELSEIDLKEKNKLELIYALLPNDIQNKIKIANITNKEEFKEQLKFAKLNGENPTSNIVSKIEDTSEETMDVSEVGNRGVLSAEQICQEKDNHVLNVHALSNNDNNGDSERDPIIKVRRTEDLMPQEVEVGEKITVPPEEFLPNDSESFAANNVANINQDNFQIDNDIMSQINNIIDESEINMSVLDNNDVAPSILSQPSNCGISLEFLGFQIEPSKQSIKSANQHNKSKTKTSRKLKKRCTYCRRFNHTAEICLKRSKHMKLFPERFIQTVEPVNNKISEGTNNEDSNAALQVNIPRCNISTTSTQPITIPTFSTQIPTTSTSFADTSPVATSSAVTLNYIPEKCVNPLIMTTKLIPPINGKTSNKVLAAAKLRSINTPSPKCHQCGTLGFYKSICPNCSPIYNTSNHNQYNK